MFGRVGSTRRTTALAVAILLALAGVASAQRAEYRLEQRGRPHADVPFALQVIVEGFDEQPAPAQPRLEIPGATVTPIDVTPSVSRSIQIVNGRRSEQTIVHWVLRWRVLATTAGTLRIPPITITQGKKSATASGAGLEVDAIPTSTDMKLELGLPDRPVFVGETVPITLAWTFRAQPEDPSFTIPLAGLDAFTVAAPPVTNSRRALKIAAGAKELDVPFDLDTVDVGGVEHNRLRLTLLVTPRSVPPGGKLAVPASSVVAALRVGRPDFFGNAPTRLFRAVDVARTLEVKQLPETDRPPTFTGAVGEQYSIDVRTSRSVVSLGEPVQLLVTVKSDQRLDTLSLGKLDGPGRLPKDKFTAPAESPTGELSDDGKSKTFEVVAQVTGPATEIPAIAFSYFDPKKQTYRTIHSEPIALSVKGGSVVGATDVIGMTKKPSDPKPGADTADVSLGNVELALSSEAAAADTPLGGTLLWAIVGLLYLIPLGVLGYRSWQLRTASSREEAAEVRTARKKVEALLDRANTEAAREIAGPLVAAMRELARVLGRSIDDGGLLARIETESFAPSAQGSPLSADLRSDVAGLLRRWTKESRSAARTRTSTTAAALVLVLFGAPATAHASSLADGRSAYDAAMRETDASARKTAFARAAVALGEAARAQPDHPDLLADWGNAALGAGDVGTATLAYRRALRLDGGNSRARGNLAWLRGKLPETFQPRAAAGATDTLLFFHRWTFATRLIVGAAAFAIAVLMLVPWAGRRHRAVRALAIVPALVWIAMVGSVVLQDPHTDDAVVMDGVVLRAADSAGAPAALSTPLPRGVEVTIRERRDSWTRIELPDGTAGWIPDGAVERVVP